ncbi:hypothetical protein HN911_02165 [Candidatus Bathyarchaeota archaeon]|nr:hypothetical protein [Candidatus Bathyarchaeota archaeon]
MNGPIEDATPKITDRQLEAGLSLPEVKCIGNGCQFRVVTFAGRAPTMETPRRHEQYGR